MNQNLHNFCFHDICSLMRDSALALSTFPWTWNLTWKTNSQTNLLQNNDLLNALRYQIFMPFNNIKISPACRRLRNTPALTFFWRQIAEWSALNGSFSSCRLVCPLRTLVSRFQSGFLFLKIFFLNCKMSKTHVNHSRVAVDLEKILQCGSAESKTAKNQTSWRHREWILRWTQSVTEDWVFEHFHKRLTSNM